jgi:hypothetical protein
MKSIRNFNQNKKVTTSLIVLIIIVILNLVLLVVILKINQNNAPKEISKFQTEYIKILTQNTGLKELPPRIQKDFEVLNDHTKSDEEKYEAILDLTDAFRTGYSIDRKPEARLFIINDLNNYAKKNYPKLHEPNNFKMACLDPTCGAEINQELASIIEVIRNTKVSSSENVTKETYEYHKEVIIGNLTNMALLNDSGEQLEILSLGDLVLFQLEQDENDYSTASSLLKAYLLKKYNYDYDTIRIEEIENEQSN